MHISVSSTLGGKLYGLIFVSGSHPGIALINVNRLLDYTSMVVQFRGATQGLRTDELIAVKRPILVG